MKKIILSIIILVTTELHAQWNSNTTLNTPICTEVNKQVDPRIMKDGKGGAYIVWKDYRPTSLLPDIYVQRINKYGYPLWTLNGISVCSDPADQSTPAITTDMKGGVIIAWSDWRSSIERDLYAQRIDSNGNIKWTIDGANVTNLTNREHSEKIVSDGVGGVIIAFEKQIAGLWDIWAQRLDSNGTKLWGAGGIALCPANTANRRNHRIQEDGLGGAFITWQDVRNGIDYDIYAQHVNANGTLLWGTSAKGICTAVGDQINAKVEPDSINHAAFIAWQDSRTGTDDIYMQRVDVNGNALWTLNGVPVCTASSIQSALDFNANNMTNDVIITWKDNRGGNNDIFAQKINSNGTPVWALNGISVCNTTNEQINPNITSDNNNGVIITWQDSNATSGWDIKAQRISSTGTMLWQTNGIIICNAMEEQNSPKNINDDNGGTIICWQDKRTGTNDIYAHHVFDNGTQIPTSVSHFSKNNFTIQVFPNPATHTVFIKSESIIEEITLYTLTGKKINSQIIHNKQETEFPIHEIPMGTYIITVKTKDGNYTQLISKL